MGSMLRQDGLAARGTMVAGRWRLVLVACISLACIGISSTMSSALAEMSCVECTVVISNVMTFPPMRTGVPATAIFLNVDHGCMPLYIGSGGPAVPPDTPWFWHHVQKYAWSGGHWVPRGGGSGTSPSIDIGADYVKEITEETPGTEYAYPWDVFPNGCSDIPSQQPDQTPNPDTGKPECNNQVL